MLKQVVDVFEVMDSPSVNGEKVKNYLMECGATAEEIHIERIRSDIGSTDFLRAVINGKNGKNGGGTAPTLGIVGRLGGLGARPTITGFVSDGDGALAAVSVAAKLFCMKAQGDSLLGDVIITTHICPDAPTREHKPVPFMRCPIPSAEINQLEVDIAMDAVLSIDTTKGNKIINTRGYAISPTAKQGYLLKTSDDLLNIMTSTSGRHPHVFALTQQDITPYENGLRHINSIMQPSVATEAPVVGVAITSEVPISGCATGATHEIDVEQASRFVVEVAKSFTAGECKFYDSNEFKLINNLYGNMSRFQTQGQ